MKNAVLVLALAWSPFLFAENTDYGPDSLAAKIFFDVYDRESLAINVITGLEKCGLNGIASKLREHKKGSFEAEGIVRVENLNDSELSDRQMDAMNDAIMLRTTYMLGLDDGFKAIMAVDRDAFCGSMADLANKELNK